MSKPLVVAVGCPSGVGPEVSVRAALESEHASVLVASEAVAQRALDLVAPEARIKLCSLEQLPSLKREAGVVWVYGDSRSCSVQDAPMGAPSPEAGRAQLAWVDQAMALVRDGHGGAMVTGPVSKEAVVRGGLSTFRGHTEYLQERLGASEVVMCFWSPALITALVTTHMALSRVPAAITPQSVATSAYWLATLLTTLGNSQPIAVSGLNPHAGESGLLGDEESRISAGMVLAASRLGSNPFVGPVPSETAFRKAQAGHYGGVVAMYHDQATIPMKLTGFGDAVNLSLGLPIVRTSVDHGTGYDIAGRGEADARGMASAMELAARLCG